MSTLDRVAKSHGTDKCSEIHDYCVKYEKYLPFKRYEELNILEIGVLDGKSLRTWKEYYYRSNILGIDINPNCKEFEETRINVEIGSQTDGIFLSSLSQKYGSFDLIIDDGSHINSDVIFSFQKLWDNVKSGGVYVIEDSCTSYWDTYGGGFKRPTSIIEYFKDIIDDVNFRGIESSHKIKNARRDDYLISPYKNMFPNAITDIESINFLNSIIIIRKR